MWNFLPLVLLALAAQSGSALLAARQPVYARRAMVVTCEPHATDAGLAILQAGGNAIDAAVTVGLVLAVTHPTAGNIGGGGFMLIRLAGGRTAFLDFRERAPEASSRNMYLDAAGKLTRDSIAGYRAPGVPGTVRGLEYASKKYGSKPWAELVAPAVELASKGFPVSYGLARSLRGKAALLGSFADSKRVFLRDGKFYEPGETLVQPDLARTLDRIRRDGSQDFYEGETARLLAADMQAHGGLITAADLRDYRVVERKPLSGSYRGYTIVTAPPPSSGGLGILQMLGVLEGSGYEKSGVGSAASLHFMAETMRRYFADRAEFLGDPDFVEVPVSRLLDRRYITRLRQSIDPAHATPSARIRPGAWGAAESAETTHYSIIDGAGNAVAVTYTLNGGYGSGVTASGLGFLLNNEMDDFAAKPGSPNLFGLIQGEANAIQPRKTPLSSMTPAIVLRDGRFYMAVGSPGGPTIINTVLQVIVNVLDFGMNIQEAVDWPRIHHQWYPDEIRMERGFSPDTIALLRSRGHKIGIVNSMGEAAAVLAADGWLQGAADPRTEGTAKGY
ncbi:MAG: gamma-glutamyltransferase [Acidobacteria bacterium]|nr:gamma-glutamyltransferase [Acidobacteriota bacterium]